MAFNVAPNPAPNPAGFMSAAVSAWNNSIDTADRLRATAAQQQKLQQQQAQTQFNNDLKLHQAGYTPYLETTGQQASGLKTRDAQPNVDPSRIITDPYGRRWVAPDKTQPTPAQQQTATHENTDDLLRALDKGGQPVSSEGTVFQMGDVPRMSMSPEGNLSNTGQSGVNVEPQHPELVQNIGGKQVYMPSEGERAETELGQKTRQADALRHLSEFPIPAELANKLGLDTSNGNGATLNDILNMHTKLNTPDKPDASAIVPGMTGPGGGLVVFDKKTQTTSEVPLPKGSRRELSPAQVEAKTRGDERAAAREQAGRDAAQKQIDTYQQQEQGLHGMRSQWGDLIRDAEERQAAAPKTKLTVIDPETKREVPWTEQRKKYYQTKIDVAGRKVEGLQGDQRKLIERHGGQASAAAPAAGGAPPQAKNASLDQIRAYATQKRISEAAATREFQASGYSIGK